MKGELNVDTTITYDSTDAINCIKKKYPLIPRWIIKRVLYAEEIYMHKIGIIKYEPKLSWWGK